MKAICTYQTQYKLKSGDNVTWTNYDDTLHTKTSGSGTDENRGAMFDSGMMGKGKTFEHTFATAGEYPYFMYGTPGYDRQGYCILANDMKTYNFYCWCIDD